MMGKPKKPENKAPDVIGVRGWIATDKGPLAGVVREVVRGGWYCFEPDDMFGGGAYLQAPSKEHQLSKWGIA